MSSTGPRPRATLGDHPLLGHGRADAIAAYRHGVPVTAAQFLRDIATAAAALPEAVHVLNLCTDRYRFSVTLLAAIARGQTTLLPPTTTPNVIAALRAFAPDAYFIADDAQTRIDLPRFDFPDESPPQVLEFQPQGGPRGEGGETWDDAPRIPAEQQVACVFTSGSTGEPQPNFKTWGALVADVQAEGRRFGIAGAGHVVLGTVPPQHMFGFESTVLLPIVCGAALTAERLYYPGEISAAIARLAAHRTLFTTPFHLRAWLGAAEPAKLETIVSATAPLSLELAREAEERTGAQLLEIYGCTEAGQIATRRPTHSTEWELYPGLRLREQAGRAVVSGGHVEQPTPLQDALEIRADGRRFLLHGRLADLVNIAGKRNSLGYLNHQLATIPGVEDGVFFVPDEQPPDGVTRLMAFVVAPTLSTEAILAALRERLDAAFVPRPLRKVDALPRERTGKLTRAALRALAERLSTKASS